MIWGNDEGKRSRKRVRATWPVAVLGLLLLGSGSALAQLAVFQSPSDDGVDPGAAASLPAGTSGWLNLYLNPGIQASLPGEGCQGGGGDEMCGWDLQIDAVDGLAFDAFEPTGGVLLGAVLLILGWFARCRERRAGTGAGPDRRCLAHSSS